MDFGDPLHLGVSGGEHITYSFCLVFFTCEVENKNSNLEMGNVLGFKKTTEEKAPQNLLVWPPLVTSK